MIERLQKRLSHGRLFELVDENVDKIGVPDVLQIVLALLELDGDVVAQLMLIERASQPQASELDHEHVGESDRFGRRALA